MKLQKEEEPALIQLLLFPFLSASSILTSHPSRTSDSAGLSEIFPTHQRQQYSHIYINTVYV